MQNQIYITKANGEREEFREDKLLESLKRAKAKPETVQKIVDHVRRELRDGISTKEIYGHAFELLRSEERPAAVRYSIKKAVMDLGPSGFPFEKFVAEIFRSKGFETITDVEMLGECVPHEVDVVAWNENKLIVVEAKFHNQLIIKSDLKVVLYIHARFQDLGESWFDYGKKRKIDESWLVTNTKFSKQAIIYAECKNMKIVGWNYPENGSLQDLIEEAGLHPITCLESISKTTEQLLLARGVVLCKQAKENLDIAKQIGMTDEEIAKMVEEIDTIQN